MAADTRGRHRHCPRIFLLSLVLPPRHFQQAFVPFDPAGAVAAGALESLITVIEKLRATLPAPGQPVAIDSLADSIIRITPAAVAISAMVGMQARQCSGCRVLMHCF